MIIAPPPSAQLNDSWPNPVELVVRILIIGGTGLLGAELLRQASLAGHAATGTFLSRTPTLDTCRWHRLDSRSREQVHDLMSAVRPDLVINAGFRQHDWASTADSAALVAIAAEEVGARMVQVSSDAVFSGTAHSYDETAVPDPITPYGAAKAAAETAVRAIAPTAVVARTSLIIGPGSSHVRRVHALANGKAQGVLFTDDIRCPVDVSDLAAALLELGLADHPGIHHVGGAEAISRYALGVLIARRDGLPVDRLTSGSRADSETPGPIAVRLDSSWTQRRLTTRLRGAADFLSPASQ